MIKDNKEFREEEIQSLYEDVLHRMDETAMLDIQRDEFCAYQCDDERTPGYYFIKIVTTPFALQEDQLVEACGMMKAGTMVCRAIYWNPVPSAKNWYTPPTTNIESNKKLFRVRYIVANPFVNTVPISNENRLPNGLEKRLKQCCVVLGARKIPTHAHEAIIDEIARRALIDYYEGDAQDREDSDDEIEDNEQTEEDEDSEEGDVEVMPTPKQR